jgi:hypothetical protein
MNRRTTLVLTGVALLGFAAATLPDLGFAQSNPLIGTWKLNLDKLKFSPGTSTAKRHAELPTGWAELQDYRPIHGRSGEIKDNRIHVHL